MTEKKEMKDVEVVDVSDPSIGAPVEDRGWRHYAAKHGFTSLGGKSAGRYSRRWGSGWQGHRPYSTDFMGAGGRSTGDFYSRFKVNRGEFKNDTSRLYRKAAETVLDAIGDRSYREGKAEISAGEILRKDGEWATTGAAKALRGEIEKAIEKVENSTDPYIRRKVEKAKTSVVHATSLARHVVNAAKLAKEMEEAGQTPDREGILKDKIEQDQYQTGETGNMSLDQVADEVQKHIKGQNPGAGLFSNRGEGKDGEGTSGGGRGTTGGSTGTSLTEAEAEAEASIFAALVQTGGAEIRILGELIPHFQGRERYRGRESTKGVPVGMTRTRELEMIEEESLVRFLRKDIDVVEEYIERGLLGFRQVDYTPQVQGDFTIMVDVSGSMLDELWAARVVTAAVCAAAIQDGRKVHVYPFNTALNTDCHVEIDPAAPKSPLLILAEVSHKLNMAFGGGTDINDCLEKGKKNELPGFANDDDLFIITDGSDEHYGPDYHMEDPMFSHPGKVVFCHLVRLAGCTVEDMWESSYGQSKVEDLAADPSKREGTFYGGVARMMLLQEMWKESRSASFGYFVADTSLSGDDFVEQLTVAADAALDVND